MIFGSRAWRDEAFRVLPLLSEQFGHVESGAFVISEAFVDVPPNAETVIWSARFLSTGVELGELDLPDADFYLRGPYRVLLPLGRTVIGTDPSVRMRYNALRQEIADGGEIVFRGDLSRSPPPVAQILAAFHDHMARLTD